MKPPPQTALIGAGLAWNYQRSRVGKTTISQYSRSHRGGFLISWAALTWLVPHILRRKP